MLPLPLPTPSPAQDPRARRAVHHDARRGAAGHHPRRRHPHHAATGRWRSGAICGRRPAAVLSRRGGLSSPATLANSARRGRSAPRVVSSPWPGSPTSRPAASRAVGTRRRRGGWRTGRRPSGCCPRPGEQAVAGRARACRRTHPDRPPGGPAWVAGPRGTVALSPPRECRAARPRRRRSGASDAQRSCRRCRHLLLPHGPRTGTLVELVWRLAQRGRAVAGGRAGLDPGPADHGSQRPRRRERRQRRRRRSRSGATRFRWKLSQPTRGRSCPGRSAPAQLDVSGGGDGQYGGYPTTPCDIRLANPSRRLHQDRRRIEAERSAH